MEVAYLIDKSALVRLSQSSDVEHWAGLISRGLVAVSSLTLLEIGFSARNGADHEFTLENPPITNMPVVSVNPKIERRALEVQRLLAERGLHRAPSVADLLIAASAEVTGRALLHVDKDFELIASVTGQPEARLVF